MSRKPIYEKTNNERPAKVAAADRAAAGMIEQIERPGVPYPPKRGGRAIPDRTRVPRIGAACDDGRPNTGRPDVRIHDQPRIGPTDSGLPDKQSAYDRARREGRG